MFGNVLLQAHTRVTTGTIVIFGEKLGDIQTIIYVGPTEGVTVEHLRGSTRVLISPEHYEAFKEGVE